MPRRSSARERACGHAQRHERAVRARRSRSRGRRDAAPPQTLFRAPGACARRRWRAGRDLDHHRVRRLRATATRLAGRRRLLLLHPERRSRRIGSTAPGDGRHWRTPTGTVAVRRSRAPNFVRGAVTLTRRAPTPAPASPPASCTQRAAGAACLDGPVGTAAWDTTRVADGTYDICNVVTDNAGNAATADRHGGRRRQHRADRRRRTPPATGAIVGGTAVRAHDDAADDATASATCTGSARRTGTQLATTAALGAVATRRTGFAATGTRRPAGGASARRRRLICGSSITDNAGNALTITTPAGRRQHGARRQGRPDGSARRRGQPDAELDAGARRRRHRPLRGAPRRRVIGHRRRRIAGARDVLVQRQDRARSGDVDYIVRAFDGAATSSTPTPSAVLVDSTAVSAPRSAHRARRRRPRRRCSTGRRRATFAVDHYDVYRDGLLARLDDRAGADVTRTRRPPRARTTTPCSPATPPSQPGVLSSSFKVVFDKTRADERRRADRAGAGERQRQARLAGRGRRALGRRRLRRAPRAPGGTPPAAADGGTAVCAPAAPGCADASAADRHLVVRRLRPRRRRQRRADRHGLERRDRRQDAAARADEADGHAGRRRRSRRRRASRYTLHWVKPTAADLDRIVVVLNLKHAPAGAADGKADLPRPRHVGQGQAARRPDRLPRALRLRPQRQLLAQAGCARRHQARLADPAAPAQRQHRAHRPAAADLEGPKGSTVLQRAGLPQRQARARRLALDGLLPHPAGQAQAGHVRLVRVARGQAARAARRRSAS